MRSLGYLAIYAPIALLVLGRHVEFDLMLPLAFFVAMPILRPLVGSVQPKPRTDWSEREAAFLRWLPRLYAIAITAAMLWVGLTVQSGEQFALHQRVEFALACLVMCGLASCVAHDLAHRPGAWDRRAAHWISALVGYPFFVFEHWLHHALPRDVEAAHCPGRQENVWTYAIRRGLAVPGLAVRFARSVRHKSPDVARADQIWTYVGVTGLVWAAFALLGGWYGFMLYAGLVVGVPFLLNTITYIQHWGLGADGPPEAKDLHQLGWDEGARVQSWLILGIALHHDHHEHPAKPYYTYGPSHGAPRLPAEYALMVLVCFFPPLWRRVMNPVLERWATDRALERPHQAPVS